jgi:hypothetical protein
MSAATALPPPRHCQAAPAVVLCAATALPPPPCRRHAAADVALGRCRHRQRRAVALPPPPLTLPLPPRCHQAAAERVRDFITQLFSQL